MVKILRLVLKILMVLIIAIVIVSAAVQVRSWYTKQYKFDIKPGQRIIVVDENTTQVRVYPKESRIFDTGRIKKGLKGVLTEK